ncbi:MAG: DEAD/DEAH box helicase, partial [Terriglobia bacterium]
DEMHTLRGVYGSNCANVLARLRRVLDRYMARTQYILTSATIGNPGQLARALIGQDVEVVSDDGSPRRRKTFVFWNPPFLDEKVRVRKSANSESSRVFTRLVENDVKTIVFSKSRQTAELIHKYADDRLKGRRARDSAFADDPLIAPYRAGYLPEERRDIEARFGDGRLRGVSSTNALELGLDIGGLDACVINGFPGTVSSFFQQAGRCGRSQVDSAVFFVGSGDPLDQHYLKHPRDLFGQPHEDALVDPGNESILDSHLVCAAYEFPLAARDRRYFGTGLEDRCSTLADSGQLVHREGRWFYKPRSEDRFPAANINIRSASQRLFSIIDAASGALMGTIDHANAFFYVHPGAIYLHQGQSYFVTELDLDRAVALVKPAAGDYYTQPRDLTDISVIETLHSSRLAGGRTFFGRVRVTTEVIGYQKKRVLTGELLGEETLDLPPQDFQTEAFWFLISPGLVEELELSERELAGGVHAAEHGAIAMLPFFAMCDRRDIGGVSTPAHPETGQATVFIYDGYQGGVGIAKRGYEIKDEYLLKTVRMIEDCDCDEGCPACVVSPKCGNFNEPLDKQAAVRILTRILAVNLARSNE